MIINDNRFSENFENMRTARQRGKIDARTSDFLVVYVTRPAPTISPSNSPSGSKIRENHSTELSPISRVFGYFITFSTDSSMTTGTGSCAVLFLVRDSFVSGRWSQDAAEAIEVPANFSANFSTPVNFFLDAAATSVLCPDWKTENSQIPVEVQINNLKVRRNEVYSKECNSKVYWIGTVISKRLKS